MDWKKLSACLVGGLLSLTGCISRKTMPASELVGVEYTRTSSMRGFEYEGRVRQDSSGAFVIRAMKKSHGPLFEKKLGAEEMRKFREIIEEEKMYTYKEKYHPIMHVLDGWGWQFTARFADGTKIYSYGTNARPSGNGLAKIRDYMEELVVDGVQIESSEYR